MAAVTLAHCDGCGMGIPVIPGQRPVWCWRCGWTKPKGAKWLKP